MTAAEKVELAYKIYQHHHEQCHIFMKNNGATWEEALAEFEKLRPEAEGDSLFDVISGSLRHFGEEGYKVPALS